MEQRAVILFAHGSRDPLWRQPMDAVAQRMQAMQPEVMVRCAFLELTSPDLPTSAGELVALGAKNITVLPMFLGVGKHAREDLPVLMGQLMAAHPEVIFRLQPAVGEQPRLVELLAQMALDTQVSQSH